MPPMPTPESLAIAQKAFGEIRARFPHLEALEDTHAEVEYSLTFPNQKGLKHRVNLNLQNGDELHFSVSHFWLEWFPCRDPSIVQNYVSAVSGFLSGELRIVEYYKGNKCVKSVLQKHENSAWCNMGASYKSLWFLLPTKKNLVIVRND